MSWGAVLYCPRCSRKILGMTGLDEIHNLIAHMQEHHSENPTMEEALELRVRWEREGARRRR